MRWLLTIAGIAAVFALGVVALVLLTRPSDSRSSEQVASPSLESGPCSTEVIKAGVEGVAYVKARFGYVDEVSAFTAAAASMASSSDPREPTGSLEFSRYYIKQGKALQNYIHRIVVMGMPVADKATTGGVYLDCGEPLPVFFNGEIPQWTAAPAATPPAPVEPTIPVDPQPPIREDLDYPLPQFDGCFITSTDFPAVKKEMVDLDCKDNVVLRRVQWSEWTSTRALGSGVLDEPDYTSKASDPDTPRIRRNVTIVLDRPESTTCGVFFSRAVFTPITGVSSGKPEVFEDMAPGSPVPKGTPAQPCYGWR